MHPRDGAIANGRCVPAVQSLALAHADVTDDTVFFSPWHAPLSVGCCLSTNIYLFFVSCCVACLYVCLTGEAAAISTPVHVSEAKSLSRILPGSVHVQHVVVVLYRSNLLCSG